MDRSTNKITRRFSRIAVLMIFFLLILFNSVFADTETDETFENLIKEFEETGVIPETDGKYLNFGSYEDSLAVMGYSSMIPLLEAKKFVVSVKLSWISAILTPNSDTSGCGIFFNAADGTTDHVMVSLRMDGTLNLTGSRRYNPLSYAKYLYATPSYKGDADLVLVVDGSNIAVYLNGERYLRQGDLPISGNVIGLAVLSGSYHDYGTRCTFDEINIYAWY